MDAVQQHRLSYELEQYIRDRLCQEQEVSIEDEEGFEHTVNMSIDEFAPAIETLARDIVRDFIVKGSK
jgi:hypothetical protein